MKPGPAGSSGGMPRRETRRARAEARQARGEQARQEQAREEQAREDYHDPTAGFGGAPPARSALTLRLVLAAFGLVSCGLGAAAFLIFASEPLIAGILAFLAAVAAADIVVVTRRKLRGEPG
jgi:Flp pilus assembly protein TadB